MLGSLTNLCTGSASGTAGHEKSGRAVGLSAHRSVCSPPSAVVRRGRGAVRRRRGAVCLSGCSPQSRAPVHVHVASRSPGPWIHQAGTVVEHRSQPLITLYARTSKMVPASQVSWPAGGRPPFICGTPSPAAAMRRDFLSFLSLFPPLATSPPVSCALEPDQPVYRVSLGRPAGP